MKRALAFALLMAGSRLDAGEIIQKPLDEFVIYNIPVAVGQYDGPLSFGDLRPLREIGGGAGTAQRGFRPLVYAGKLPLHPGTLSLEG
jgi:hypothetical protein